MYVRYKKNIQENDLPRKRVRKASKIAGSGGQYLENKMPREGTETKPPFLCCNQHFNIWKIRCLERGRKCTSACSFVIAFSANLENKMPREGTEIAAFLFFSFFLPHLENKMPREGTEIFATP